MIAIVGPTASGKSALGIWLAKKINGEIISADSRQVYKGLNIATGKVTKKEMQGVKHHLLDVVSPKKQFSVDDFIKHADRACSNILQNDRTILVVGGTGLYVDMLLGRMSYPQVPPKPTLRKKLEKKSAVQLYALLQKIDPARAKTIEKQNPRRLVRAIEIAKALGKNPPANPEPKYEVLWLGLSPTPEKLKKNIRIRLFSRIGAGMIAEAKKLHAGGLSYKRMEQLGLEYRYLARLLQNKLTKQEFKLQLEREINQYAKRQMRWFVRNKDINWVGNKSEALLHVKNFLRAMEESNLH